MIAAPSVVVVIAILGLLAGPLVSRSGPAGAVIGQSDRDSNSGDGDGSDVVLEVVDQSTFVAADGALYLDLAIDLGGSSGADPGPTPGRRPGPSREDRYFVAVTVYGMLETEAAVSEPLSQPLNRLDPIDLEDVPSNQPGRYQLEVPIRSGAQFDDRNRLLLPNPGVYPVSIELRSDGGPVASARTHLVRLPQVTNQDGPVDEPLPVAIVLNVYTAEGLTITDVQQILTDHPSVPLTVVLQQGVENQLRSDPELAAGFAAALAGRPVLAVPAIDLDPSALAEIGQADLYAAAATAARSDLLALGLTSAGSITLLDAPLTEAGAAVVGGVGFRSVLDTGSGSAVGGRLGTDRLGAGGRRLQVVRLDHQLSQILGGGTDGPHRANRVLAKLTMRGLVDDAPVVLGGSALGVDPGPSINAFLRALSQPGAPRPILVSEVTNGPSLRVAERPEQNLMPVSDLLEAVQDKLVTYEGFFGGGGNTPDQYRDQILSALTRQRNPRDRRRALELIDSRLDDDMAVIELHDGQPVTLAARAAPIPITVENSSAGPRAVMLQFRSDKVVATEDRQLVTIGPGTSSIDVELETRSLGVSPLEVSVWTPDGATLLADTRFEIRSTAVPGLGLLVSSGAVGLLGAWWIVDIRRRRASSADTPADGAK